MNRIKILMDSGGDVPQHLLEQYDITIVPLTIIVDEKEYTDFYELSRKQYFDLLAGSRELPRTSQPNPHTFLQYFRKFEADYDEIIYIGMSSNGSGTYQSGCIAIQDYEQQEHKAKIFPFDTWNATVGIGYFAIQAARLREEGMDCTAIVQRLTQLRQHFASYLIPETLEYLKKGGRVNTVTSIIGGLLDIRPVITICEGWGRNYGKVRGARQAVSRLAELFQQQHADLEAYISHCNNIERAQELAALLRQKFQDICVEITEMGPVLSTHAGPGTIGLHFLRKDTHTLTT